MSLSSSLAPRELALDEERRRLTTPRKDVRLSKLFDRSERDSSLLVLLDFGRGDRRPLDVDGRESASCADFRLHDTEARRIQDGESRSFDAVDSVPVDITSSDMNTVCAEDV
jgi:hypothetical protein